MTNLNQTVTLTAVWTKVYFFDPREENPRHKAIAPRSNMSQHLDISHHAFRAARRETRVESTSERNSFRLPPSASPEWWTILSTLFATILLGWLFTRFYELLGPLRSPGATWVGGDPGWGCWVLSFG